MARGLLYEVPVSDIWAVPHVAGVYVLRDFNHVYCGSSDDVRRRFPEILGEQRFGHYFNYFSEEFLGLPSNDLTMTFLRDLETNTISALNTLIYGNGLPLWLTNEKDVTWLPSVAWERDAFPEYQLAIDIARTTLFGMGVPLHMTKLPHYGIFRTDLPLGMHEINKAEWGNILNAELAERTRSKSTRPPMFVIHPA